MTTRSQLLTVGVLLLFASQAGCRSMEHAQHCADAANAKVSFWSWNVRSSFSTPEEACWSRPLAIASRKPSELKSLMETCPRPCPCQIAGPWLGINKGFGAAAAGLTQDIKVFESNGCGACGHNVSIHQVPIDQLDCRGWQPKIDPETGQPETMGNFVVCCSDNQCEPLELNYTIAENKWNDPSKILVDDLVVVDHGIMLGRAHAKVGMIKVPVAYFVLYRPEYGGCCQCSHTCNSCAK